MKGFRAFANLRSLSGEDHEVIDTFISIFYGLNTAADGFGQGT
jgi:hypothetical protein